MLTFDTSVQYVKGVGPRRAEVFAGVGIHTVEDLVYYFPFRYEDRTNFRRIDELTPGEEVVISGRVISSAVVPTRRTGFVIFQALVDDGTAAIKAIWFNQPYLRDSIKNGRRIVLFGSLSFGGKGTLILENPEFELVDEKEVLPSPHMGRIVPIYRRLGSITSRGLRKIIYQLIEALGGVEEIISSSVVSKHNLLSRKEALCLSHFPPADWSASELNSFRSRAHLRLIFEELFLLEAGLALRRSNRMREKGISFIIDDSVRERARKVLPFPLTRSQKRVLSEIASDMAFPHPMRRLLQGDVGSGKTIVALLSMIIALESGYQSALMAPTEILAEQHCRTIKGLLSSAGYPVVLLTSGVKGEERDRVLASIKNEERLIIIGTHALLEENVSFRRLGLVVIDEQHRFGVLQRTSMVEKGINPDVLVMTATPIPRSLALTIYGDLDLSVIDELPPGRKQVRTIIKTEESEDDVHRFLRKEMENGRQVFVVCPLVEERESSDLKAAKEEAERLKDIFSDFTVGLIHGRMRSEDKEEVMRRFTGSEIDLLVSTTVIELGIDIPNVSVIVIEHAERFGLSQLHQLRGRVGRGEHPSYCILIPKAPGSAEAKALARKRLLAFKKAKDGFAVAEEDLKLRGPGELLGLKQAGMPALKIADIIRDRAILERARGEAFSVINKGTNEAKMLRQYLHSRWEGRFGLRLAQ
jgi:ATP-dependent DNA helicase RecG